ncbi:protein kinase, partial [Candidatus Poribacteria bacterium]|nr:protein kinase [Candidatus Poribacteria bacterium]
TPHNIMIRHDNNEAVLCDFGIAGIVSGAERLTPDHVRVSSYRYSPPESLTDDSITPDMDLWGLAVTAYVMLSGGHFPYAGSTPTALLKTIQENRLTPLSSHREDLPAGLLALIHGGLAPNPTHRPTSAREWVEGLEAFC